MAKSIKLGADTYLDASGVMMRASDRNRKTLDQYLPIEIQRISILNGSTVNVTVDSSNTGILRSFFVTVGANSKSNGIYSWIRASSLASDFYPIQNASGLTITSTGSNTFSITNSSGAYVQIFFFLGSPMGLTYTTT